MPNVIAYSMLAIWPLIAFWIFKKLPPSVAVVTAILAAYLVLPPMPVAFDFPLLPPLNKDTISHLSVLCVVVIFAGRSRKAAPSRRMQKPPTPLGLPWLHANSSIMQRATAAFSLPENPIAKALVLLFVLSPIITVLTNAEPLFFQQEVIRGLYAQDMIALPMMQIIALIGFLLTRQFLREVEDLKNLLIVFMFGGLVYSLPILVEIRLSPQINIWVYGFFQHSFDQMMRSGGFRAIVFLNHGIWVAFFVMSTVAAALALWRADRSAKRARFLFAALFLCAVLALSKTLGALLFIVLLAPLIIFVSTKTQIRAAAFLGVLAFAYPVMKGLDLVPANAMLAQAAKVDPERAASLQFRFVNEDLLAERAAEKPLFGWGSWGRNHLHDPVTGVITSVSDGRWIIVVGVYGWIGFIAEFGLLLLPILLVWRESRHLDKISPLVGPMTLMLSVNMIDLIPNATLTPLTWILSGALLGHAELLRNRRLSGVTSHAEIAPAVSIAKRTII